MGATKDDPSITVTGEAKKRVPADRAYVIIYSQEQNSSAENAISGSLKNAESAFSDVKRKSDFKVSYEIVTSGLSLVAAGAQAASGYEYLGAHCIRISCPPEDEDVYSLIDDAVGTDTEITPVSTVSSALPYSPVIYAVEDYQEIEEKLETQALADAKARAEKLAQRAGKTLGDIISVQMGLIPASGRDLDLPTPYISNNYTGVMMVQTVTVSYQLLP
jgi:uncharacterized protein YggE